MVDFNTIPAGLREPGVFAEFDGSQAQQGASIQPYKILVVGNKTASGTWTADMPNIATTVAQVRAGAGEGSMLAHMAEKLFANNRVTQATFVPQADDGAGVAATQTLTVTGTATAAGTIYLYIAGRRITTAVASGDDANTIAAAINTAIGAEDNLPMTAGVATNVVTLTARHKGVASNNLDVRINYNSGEALPAGVTSIAIADVAAGTLDPDIADIWANLGDTWYNIIIVGYDAGTAATLNTIDTEMDDRFQYDRAIDGVAFLAHRDTHANLVTLGDGRNGKHVSIMGMDGPSSPWEWAAAIGGNVALRAQADPARPYRLMPLNGIVAPADSEQFDYNERDLLLKDGISSYTVDAGGVVRLSRVITNYQVNAASAPDTAFLQVETMLSLSYIRFDFRTTHELRFPSHKLANDGIRVGPDQKIMTPALGKAFAVERARLWEERGIIENVDQFKKDIVVERPSGDPTRLDYKLPPDLVNQLFVTAARIEFLL